MSLKFDFQEALRAAQSQLPDGYALTIEVQKNSIFLQVWDDRGEGVYVGDGSVVSLLQSIAAAKKRAEEQARRLFPKKLKLSVKLS